MIRKSEREALKERRRSGEFKQDKKDARAAGLSRGEARRRAKRLSRVQALADRKAMRSDMAAKRKEDASVNKMFADRRRMEAKRGGQKLAYEGKSKPIKSMADVAPGGVPSRKMKSGDKVSQERIKTGLGKGMYKIVGADGYVRYSKSKPAMYGAKVKAVKKAKNGGKITDPPTKKKTKSGQLNPSSSDKKMKKTVKDVPKTKNSFGLDSGPFRPSKSRTSEYIALTSNPPKYRNLKTGKVISESEYYKVTGKIKKEGGLRKLKNGGALKSVPSKAKGLSKLPKGVRNKMGYMKDGGKVGSKMKSIQSKIDSIKKKKEGLISTASNYQKKTGKVFSDFGQADEIRGMESQIAKLESQLKELKGSGSGSIKKMKDGGKVVKRGMETRPAKPFRTMKEIKERRDEEKKTRRLIKK